MKKISNKIVFFGNERLATGVSTTAPTLQRLVNEGYEVAALVSNYKKETSRKNREPEIHVVARQHGIKILSPSKLKEIEEELKAMGAEVAVLVAFGKIVPQSIIDIFPKGIINIHPSLLPKHRGPTPIESVILNGETETGVSIMDLHKEMDAGPVYFQQKVRLNGNETKQELADTLLTLGGELVCEALPKILEGLFTPTTQEEAAATYDKLIDKRAGIIDWNKSAVDIEREIRAFSIWPQSKTKIADKEVAILKAHTAPPPLEVTQPPGTIEVDKDTGTLTVTTGSGILCVDEVKPAGKNAMTAKAFLAGYGEKI